MIREVYCWEVGNNEYRGLKFFEDGTVQHGERCKRRPCRFLDEATVDHVEAAVDLVEFFSETIVNDVFGDRFPGRTVGKKPRSKPFDTLCNIFPGIVS